MQTQNHRGVRYIIGDVKLAILLEQHTHTHTHTHTQLAAVSARDVIGTAISALSTLAFGEPSPAFSAQAMYVRVTHNCCALGLTQLQCIGNNIVTYYRNNTGFGTHLSNTKCVL
jgi:hypothetical protein